MTGVSHCSYKLIPSRLWACSNHDIESNGPLFSSCPSWLDDKFGLWCSRSQEPMNVDRWSFLCVRSYTPHFLGSMSPPFMIRYCIMAIIPATVFIILCAALSPWLFSFLCVWHIPSQTPLSLCVWLHALATSFISLHEAPCPCNHFYLSAWDSVPH